MPVQEMTGSWVASTPAPAKLPNKRLVEGGDDVIYGDSGDDALRGQSGNDPVSGGDGNDRIELGGGNDLAFGDAGQDLVSGEEGNDVLNGGDGDNIIRGDAGTDTVIGDSGADPLWGGADADRFVFKGAGALTGQDTVMDFQNGIDLLVLERLGIRQYSDSGANGTVFAYDGPSGDVLIKGYDSAGDIFSAVIKDQASTLTASSFNSADCPSLKDSRL